MKPINIKKAKIKNLIGILDEPTFEDLLFEIVLFLSNEQRFEGEEAQFKASEAFLKTRIRVSSTLSDDLNTLVDMGYLAKMKHAKYHVVKHLWE